MGRGRNSGRIASLRSQSCAMTWSKRRPISTTASWTNIWKARSLPSDELMAALRKGTLAVEIVPVLAGAAFKNKGVQRLLDAVVDYLPSPLDSAGRRRARSQARQDHHPQTGRRRTLFRPRLQDHDRSAHGQAGLLARLFRHGRGRNLHPEPPRGPQGTACSACCSCTPTSARTFPRSPRATSPWPSDSATPKPATRFADTKHPIVLESMHFPDPGHLGRHRAQNQGRPGPADRIARQADGRRPDLPGQFQRRDRTDHDRRHGRTSPRDPGGPADARIQGQGQRRQTAGRIQGNHHQVRPGRRPFRPADRRARAVRARGHPPRTRDARNRVRFRKQDHGRRHSQGIHPRGVQGHRRGHEERAPGRLSAWWTSRSPCSTDRTTPWIPPKSPSRSRDPWRSRTACARPVRSCSNRS